MPSVFIETTIPSFYFETRTDPTSMAWRNATRRWWDRFSKRFRLVTSDVVHVELAAAPQPKGSQCLTLIEHAEILAHPAGIDAVIDHYIQNRLLPRTAIADAAHLAIASWHGVDFLLTWNCRHLANASKARHMAVLNGRLGLPTPVVPRRSCSSRRTNREAPTPPDHKEHRSQVGAPNPGGTGGRGSPGGPCPAREGRRRDRQGVSAPCP